MDERRVVNDDAGVASFFSKVYTKMGLGLGLTGLLSYLLAVPFQQQYLTFIGQHQILAWIFLFLPFIMTFMVSGRRAQQNTSFGNLMFYLFSASFAFQISLVLMVYPTINIFAAFVVTAVIFVSMSLVGRFGHKDLSKAGSIAYTALWGVIVMSLVNMFIASSGLQWLINYAILAIFIVMTAFDTQKLKQVYLTAGGTGDGLIAENALVTQGALMLYLDFLNLFLVILRIFGGVSRD
ncbi:Bax inhibitor-1/YccA family protein [Lacticaseibacillus yichunensis]|uniref:Bax inhibitor-1 family protein n=2 Tax=Bacilli TaxID=91061 RepID=A0ABW4CPV3_9LACO|nr:Bax inhibitor-1/YccA family protein [Lacticaseibacillus yichunensis]